MTSRDFAFWLQGFFEVSNAETITKEQTQVINIITTIVITR